jgi:hypothetical protein
VKKRTKILSSAFYLAFLFRSIDISFGVSGSDTTKELATLDTMGSCKLALNVANQHGTFEIGSSV